MLNNASTVMNTDTLSPITICERCGHSVPSSINLSQESTGSDQIRRLRTGYDEEIASLEATLILLKEKRADLAGKENTLGSPICRLPIETLEQIFGLSCSENILTDLTRVPEALALSRTCEKFRSICLGSPSLWSSISLVYKEESVLDAESGYAMSHQTYNTVRHRLKQFLYNSDDSLLDVRIDAYFTYEEYRHRYEDALLEILCDSADQWKSLALCFEIAQNLENAMNGYKFWSLNSVILHLSSDRRDYYDDIFSMKNSLFSRAPVLKSVEYRCDNGGAFLLPWVQVTKLNTGKYFWFPKDDFNFRDFSNLKSWEAGYVLDFADPDEAGALENTHFQDLTMLSLNNFLSGSEDFLGYMTAPSLVYLSFIDAHLRLTSLVAFLERSSCMLTSFTLCRIKCTAEDIAQCLKHMPKLRALSLSERKMNSFISTALLDCLSSSFRSQRNAVSQVTLAALHDLTLGGSFNESRDAAITMLKSWAAMPGKPSLEEGRRHFEIHIYDYPERIDECFVKELMSMNRKGLRVTIL